MIKIPSFPWKERGFGNSAGLLRYMVTIGTFDLKRRGITLFPSVVFEAKISQKMLPKSCQSSFLTVFCTVIGDSIDLCLPVDTTVVSSYGNESLHSSLQFGL